MFFGRLDNYIDLRFFNINLITTTDIEYRLSIACSISLSKLYIGTFILIVFTSFEWKKALIS